MMLKVMYAIGSRWHITGNEEIVTVIMSKEEFDKIRNSPDYIICNVCKA